MQLFPGHTAVSSLYLSTDRSVDPKLLAAAFAYDREHFAKSRPPEVRLGRIRVKRHIAVGLMAQEIVRNLASRGCVTADDFRRLGLSDAQIDEFKVEAFGQAIVDCPGLEPVEG